MSEPADDAGLEEVTQFLLRPESYPVDHFPPGKPRRVELVETHISRVFFAGDRVYKLKKPVKFEFLDFSTLDRRREACRDEVRLNRRMAGDAYLGVVPVLRRDGDMFSLGELEELNDSKFADVSDHEFDVVDWVVLMRRLDGDRMLDNLLRENKVQGADIDRLVKYLAEFYSSAKRVDVSERNYLRDICRHVRANRIDLLATVPENDLQRVRRIHAAQIERLHGDFEIFSERVKARQIVDGHGDLRPEHICLETPPVIYDCVEFSPEFRRIDVIDELGFLLMECQRLGHAETGRRIFWNCVERLGDRVCDELLDFYVSYRACVRAKVAALRTHQQDGPEREESLAELRQYLSIAEAGTSPGRWTLYVFRGLMGSGKSTLAAALAEDLGIKFFRTDDVRRELQGMTRTTEEFGTGRYSADSRRRVYDEVLRRCDAELCLGNSVIADGTFLTTDVLRQAAATAARNAGYLVVIECRCPAEVSMQRVAHRLARGQDASEARPELYGNQAKLLEPVPYDIPTLIVDTTQELYDQLAKILSGGRHSVS